jgi:putative DNA primase/helicase
MEQALKPLKLLAAKAAERHAEAMQEYEQAARILKLRAEASEKAARAKLAKDASANISSELVDLDTEEPKLKRYIANDTSYQALGELLRYSQNGVLVYRDELVSLLKALDREDNAEARGFYLTGWNGDSSYTFDRIGRGANLHIPAVCLSVLGSTQPGRISEYLRTAVKGGAGDDGLIQRFGLLVWPDNSDWRDVDATPNAGARAQATEVFKRLDEMDAKELGAAQDAEGELPYLRFTPEALEMFREWRAELEEKLRKGDLHPALESHLAKYRKLVPGIALICHLADHGNGPVSPQATTRALAWAQYLETHARRAYASVTAPEVIAAKAILAKLKAGELQDGFTARDIYRAGWAFHLSERESVAAALQLLDDLDWIFPRVLQTEGRSATVYTVNPRGR